MSFKNNKEFTKDQIAGAIAASTTMGGAAKILRIDWRTFKKEALKYGLYKPSREKFRAKFETSDILEGKHPQYPTSKLSRRLVKEGYFEYKCSHCSIQDWNDKPLTLELDHIDGDNSNHQLDNLRLLCPNCHSQTPTYRNRKTKPKDSG